MPLQEKNLNRPLNERRSKPGKPSKKEFALHNKFDSLKVDDEDKENVPPPPTFGGFSSRRKPGPPMPRSLSATKRDSFGAIVTGQNLAGPPLKLRSNDISKSGPAPQTTAPLFVTPTLPLSSSTTPVPFEAVPENWTAQQQQEQYEGLCCLPTESHHLHVESGPTGYGETYQYDGYENQVLMAPNYAESVAAVPMIFHQNVVNTPVTEVQTPIAATATVSQNGFLSFQLSHGIVVNIGPNFAVQILNPEKNISLSLSGCATQMALVHPQGRVLQYNSRIEVHSRGSYVEKNAKIWPRGISFTASNCAIVYLVDQAGTRSTSDQFHDLYSEDSSESIFSLSCSMYDGWSDAPMSAHERSTIILENVEYWHTEKAHFWSIDEGGCIIQQAFDGYVTVERKYGSELFTMKTSPSNGKARLQSSFIYITASEGPESHLFVKSKDRRIHHSEKAFTVRNAGHSAGFDETGSLRIY